MRPENTIHTGDHKRVSGARTPLHPDHAHLALIAARNALTELTCEGGEFAGFPHVAHQHLMQRMKDVLGFDGSRAQPGKKFMPSRKVNLKTVLNQLDRKTPPEAPTEFNKEKRMLWFEMGMAVRKTLKESGYDITSPALSQEAQDRPR